MTVVTASSTPNLSTITGVTEDPNSDLLYISTSSGYLFTWNEATSSFVSSIDVGQALSSVAISADGKTLAVGEYSSVPDKFGGSSVTAVGLISLSSKAVQTLTLNVTTPSYLEGGVVSLGFDANGNLLVSTNGQWIPYHFIPAGSQSFGSDTVAGSSPLPGGSWVKTGLDHRYVVLFEGNSTGAPLNLYDSKAGEIVAQSSNYSLGTLGFNSGTGDINSSTGMIAYVVGGSVMILNLSLEPVSGPGTTDTILGARFNASGSTLYLWDTTSDSVLVYDTKSWMETGSIPISVAAGSLSGYPNPTGQMSLSQDGRYLTLLNGSGFETIDLAKTPITPPGGPVLNDTQHGAITGVAQDANSDLLYIATTSGYILTWSEATARFVSSLNVGHPLSSIALSADGKTLAVGEYSGNLDEYGSSLQTSVGLITLSSHAIQTLTLGKLGSAEGGVASLNFDANGNLLVSTDGQWVPYHFIAAGSQSWGGATVPGSTLVSSGSWVEASPDHRYVLLAEGNISDVPVQLYDTQAGKIVAQSDSYNLGSGYNSGTGDINGNAGMIADVFSGSVKILDFSLQLKAGPTTTDRIFGAHFNASGSTLYLWDATSNAVLVYDTQSWTETGSIPIPVAPGLPSGTPLNPAGDMSLSQDGRYLTLLTGSGFEIVDLTNATTSVVQNSELFVVSHGSNSFVGSSGKASVAFDLAYSAYSVARQADNSLVVSSAQTGEGPDHLTNIQTLQFSDATAQVTASGGLLIVTPLASVSAAITAASGGSDLAGIEVSDSAANVMAGLDNLQSLAASGTVNTVALTDGGTPTLSLNGMQLTFDAAALKEITSSFTLSVSVPSGSFTLAGFGNSGHGTTFVLSGTAAQYDVTGDGAGGVIVTGNGATDHFTGATALQFADATEIVAQTPGTTSITSGNIAELYAAVLGRRPDAAGLSFYTAALAAHPDQGFTTFAGYFLASAEYTGNPAHHYAATIIGETQFITDCYKNLLGRTPSSSEMDFYLNNVIEPAYQGYGYPPYSVQAAAHAQVITYFSASTEFFKDVQITAQTPASAQHWLMLV